MIASTVYEAAQMIVAQPPEVQKLILDGMTEQELKTTYEAIKFDWHLWRRPKQILPPGDWRWCLFAAGRSFGKELALDTPIPTPLGWTTMGELRLGDLVFDETGTTCRVMKVFPVTIPERAYRITFSDGQTVVASGEHRWLTMTHQERKQTVRGKRCGPTVRTTDEIFETQRYGRRKDVNHSVVMAGALKLPVQNLPIDPYVLGYWLGNGSTKDGSICAHAEDIDHVRARFEAGGIPTTKRKDPIMFGTLGLRVQLRSLGLLNNKHVPHSYLRASAEQRLELLRGLMDSDGSSVPGKPYAEFSNTTLRLAEAVLELVFSLGQRATLTVGRATLRGKDCGVKYRVCFSATIQVFSTPRKSGRNFPFPTRMSHHRMISSVVPVVRVPMRCVSVDSESALYLVGRGMIPTHNTRTETEILRAAAESGEHQYTSMISATSVTMKRTLLYGPAGIFTISPPWFRPKMMSVDEMLIWPKHPVTGVQMLCYLMSGEDPDRIRGSEVSLTILDELTTWNRPGEGWKNIDLTLRHGPNPIGIIGVTPKRTGSGVAFSKDLLFGVRGLDGKRHKREDMIMVQGSTTENVDIAEQVLKRWEQAYRGTADEMTELEGQLPLEAENALWHADNVDAFREQNIPAGVRIDRVIVSIDPSRAKTGHRDMCGIIVLAKGSDGHVYILGDHTLRAGPDEWINQGISAYARQRADYGIFEGNRLGEDNVALVTRRAREAEQRWNQVTARGTKKQRAEPVAAEYKAGRVHHVGHLPELEEEMYGWDPDETKESPNRIDALVHGVKELLLDARGSRGKLIAR